MLLAPCSGLQGLAVHSVYEMPDGSCRQRRVVAGAAAARAQAAAGGGPSDACLRLSASTLPAGPGLQARTGSAARMDDALHEALAQRGLATHGRYYLFLLPESSGSSDGGSGSSSSAVLGVHRHAWVRYTSDQQAISALQHAAYIARSAFLVHHGGLRQPHASSCMHPWHCMVCQSAVGPVLCRAALCRAELVGAHVEACTLRARIAAKSPLTLFSRPPQHPALPRWCPCRRRCQPP